MLRRIIQIDRDKCNGCGICAEACHEGAIAIIDGKAQLIRDDYCDGLGDCLPTCPTGAIQFVVREAADYNEVAVKENMKKKKAKKSERVAQDSCLSQWPCQIKLMPVTAPYYQGADLLVAADCTAFTYASMHADFMDGKITVVGCTKLDGIDYSEKLGEILSKNEILSVTVVKMEVPCCGGLEMAVKKAISYSKKNISLEVVTISIEGKILN